MGKHVVRDAWLGKMTIKKSLLFLLISISVVVFWIYAIRRYKVKNYEVRVAYSMDKSSIPDLDPAKITSFPQGDLLKNLYSNLIEYDLNGNLQSGISTRFYWDGLRLVFEFGNKVKTKSGHYIDAEDAAVSIRRILKLGSSTHTNLKYFLCNFKEMKDVFENCESIYVEQGKLNIRIQDEKQKPFVVSALAACDFGIVPREVINKENLSITSYGETSGPYFIESMGKNWELRQNLSHYQLTPESPQKVSLISIEGRTASELFLNNEVDLLPTSFNIPQAQYEKMRTQISDFREYKTLPIKLYMVQFSLPALRKTTVEQRFHIASQFRKIMSTQYPLPILSEPAYEFFLDNGYGQLSREQHHELKNMVDDGTQVGVTSYRPTFYIYKDLKEMFSVFRQIKEIDPIETDSSPFNQALTDRLDIAVVVTDTAYEEDLSLLGYNFNQGTFGYDEKAGEAWLAKYMAEESKEKRAEMGRDLQFEGLKNGVIFPMFKAPYTVMARNGFSISMSPIFANTDFWRITKQ